MAPLGVFRTFGEGLNLYLQLNELYRSLHVKNLDHNKSTAVVGQNDFDRLRGLQGLGLAT